PGVHAQVAAVSVQPGAPGQGAAPRGPEVRGTPREAADADPADRLRVDVLAGVLHVDRADGPRGVPGGGELVRTGLQHVRRRRARRRAAGRAAGLDLAPDAVRRGDRVRAVPGRGGAGAVLL